VQLLLLLEMNSFLHSGPIERISSSRAIKCNYIFFSDIKIFRRQISLITHMTLSLFWLLIFCSIHRNEHRFLCFSILRLAIQVSINFFLRINVLNRNGSALGICWIFTFKAAISNINVRSMTDTPLNTALVSTSIEYHHSIWMMHFLKFHFS
jgi:hypothetical protein